MNRRTYPINLRPLTDRHMTDGQERTYAREVRGS